MEAFFSASLRWGGEGLIQPPPGRKEPPHPFLCPPLTFFSRLRWVSAAPRRARRCRSGRGTAPPRLQRHRGGVSVVWGGGAHRVSPPPELGAPPGTLTAREVVLHQAPVALVVAFPLVRLLLGGAEKLGEGIGVGGAAPFWGLRDQKNGCWGGIPSNKFKNPQKPLETLKKNHFKTLTKRKIKTP